MTAREWMRVFEGIAEGAANAAPGTSLQRGALIAAAVARTMRVVMQERGEREAEELLRSLAAKPAPRVDLDAIERGVYERLGFDDEGDGRDGGGD